MNDIHIHVVSEPGCCCLSGVHGELKRQKLLLGRIMTQVSELAGQMSEVNAQLVKSLTEINAQVAALQAALVNVEIPAEAQTALDNLKATAQALDDLNPDAPAE